MELTLKEIECLVRTSIGSVVIDRTVDPLHSNSNDFARIIGDGVNVDWSWSPRGRGRGVGGVGVEQDGVHIHTSLIGL